MHDWVWTIVPLQGPPPASLETGDQGLEWETLGLLDLVLLKERLGCELSWKQSDCSRSRCKPAAEELGKPRLASQDVCAMPGPSQHHRGVVQGLPKRRRQKPELAKSECVVFTHRLKPKIETDL